MIIIALRIFVIFLMVQTWFYYFSGKSMFEPIVYGLLFSILISLIEIKQKLEEMSES